MPKALTVMGMVVAGVIAFLFAVDLALGIPFDRASKIMDVCFVLCAAILGYLGWSTFREQR